MNMSESESFHPDIIRHRLPQEYFDLLVTEFKSFAEAQVPLDQSNFTYSLFVRELTQLVVAYGERLEKVIEPVTHFPSGEEMFTGEKAVGKKAEFFLIDCPAVIPSATKHLRLARRHLGEISYDQVSIVVPIGDCLTLQFYEPGFSPLDVPRFVMRMKPDATEICTYDFKNASTFKYDPLKMSAAMQEVVLAHMKIAAASIVPEIGRQIKEEGFFTILEYQEQPEFYPPAER